MIGVIIAPGINPRTYGTYGERKEYSLDLFYKSKYTKTQFKLEKLLESTDLH